MAAPSAIQEWHAGITFQGKCGTPSSCRTSTSPGHCNGGNDNICCLTSGAGGGGSGGGGSGGSIGDPGMACRNNVQGKCGTPSSCRTSTSPGHCNGGNDNICCLTSGAGGGGSGGGGGGGSIGDPGMACRNNVQGKCGTPSSCRTSTSPGHCNGGNDNICCLTSGAGGGGSGGGGSGGSIGDPGMACRNNVQGKCGTPSSCRTSTSPGHCNGGNDNICCLTSGAGGGGSGGGGSGGSIGDPGMACRNNVQGKCGTPSSCRTSTSPGHCNGGNNNICCLTSGAGGGGGNNGGGFSSGGGNNGGGFSSGGGNNGGGFSSGGGNNGGGFSSGGGNNGGGFSSGGGNSGGGFSSGGGNNGGGFSSGGGNNGGGSNGGSVGSGGGGGSAQTPNGPGAPGNQCLPGNNPETTLECAKIPKIVILPLTLGAVSGQIPMFVAWKKKVTVAKPEKKEVRDGDPGQSCMGESGGICIVKDVCENGRLMQTGSCSSARFECCSKEDFKNLCPASEQPCGAVPIIDMHALQSSRDTKQLAGAAILISILEWNQVGDRNDYKTQNSVDTLNARLYNEMIGVQGSELAKRMSEQSGLSSSKFSKTGTIDEIKKSLLKTLPVPVGVKYVRGKVVAVSETWKNLHGLSLEDNHWQYFDNIMHWIVIVGYSVDSEMFYANDPDSGTMLEFSIDDLKGMAMTDSRNEESIFMVKQGEGAISNLNVQQPSTAKEEDNAIDLQKHLPTIIAILVFVAVFALAVKVAKKLAGSADSRGKDPFERPMPQVPGLPYHSNNAAYDVYGSDVYESDMENKVMNPYFSRPNGGYPSSGAYPYA